MIPTRSLILLQCPSIIGDVKTNNRFYYYYHYHILLPFITYRMFFGQSINNKHLRNPCFGFGSAGIPIMGDLLDPDPDPGGKHNRNKTDS